MTIEVLNYCVDIQKTHSFTQTAKKFYISQQAMSQHIKNLEQEIGIQIFERTNRQVQVTTAGAAFLAEVECALTQLETALNTAKAYASGQKGLLCLGYNGPSSHKYLSNILDQYSSEYPCIEVKLSTAVNADLHERFLRGNFDLIAVGDFLCFDPDIYNILPWKSGVICAVFGKGHPFASKEVVTADELLKDYYISLDLRADPRLQQASMDRCKKILGEEPRNIKYVDCTDTIDLIVASGNGYTFLNSDLNGYYKQSRLSFVPIEGSTVVHSSRFVWRKDNTNPALAHFLKIAKKVYLEHDK